MAEFDPGDDVEGLDDDATIPTSRSAVDPLLAFPVTATGETGQIERPGDQTPWWFVPGLFAVALFFIGLLAAVNRDRDDDRRALEEANAAAAEANSDATVDAGAGIASTTIESAATPPPTEAPPVTSDPVLDRLPPAGAIRVDGDDAPIVARCEVQLPFDPMNVTVQVSSYVWEFEAGDGGLIDRVVDPSTDRASVVGLAAEFVELEPIGDAGAFAARFADGSEFVVNPPASGPSQCADRLVTNAPGQFTEPFTRTILDICVADDGAVAGLASLGSRFDVVPGDDGVSRIALVEPGGAVRLSTSATVRRSEDILSASGVVGEGDAALDISIDIGSSLDLDAAPRCTPDDRL